MWGGVFVCVVSRLCLTHCDCITCVLQILYITVKRYELLWERALYKCKVVVVAVVVVVVVVVVVTVVVVVFIII